jgi:L-2,4-diaminobutyrate decarboxylase
MHEMVDLIFDHVQQIETRPVVAWRSEEELRELVAFGENVVATDRDALVRLVTDNAIQLHHPSYMGHQVCPPFPTAAAADFLISALNQSTAVWEMSPMATVIEKEVVRWLADRAGYPPESLGTAVSGGSAANLTGLLAARARWQHDAVEGRPVILCSADAHYSIARAASIMGIPHEDVIKVPTDAEHRLDVDALDTTLAAIESGNDSSVMAIVATAGSTATGAFDRLDDIAGLRDRYRTWLHVDAAHGASLLLSTRMRWLVHGIRHADSLAWDPHKMLWMPLSFGVILVRHGEWLRRAFSADAPYLFTPERALKDIGAMTIQCSKRADAVKLWLSLKMHGTAPFEAALDRVTDVTRHVYDLVAASDDFEPLHAPDFNIFCFRYIGPSSARIAGEQLDAVNAIAREHLIRSGQAWITSTLLKGARALRVTIINPVTTEAHVSEMLEAVRRAAAATVVAAD